MKAKMKVMTTNDRANSKHDRHPARSARILTTGISVASVLGLTSAYSVAAQTNAPVSGTELIAPALVGDTVVAPTQPAPATPAARTQSAPAATAQTQVTPIIKTLTVPAPITLMVLPPNPPATRSSGSK